MYNAIEVSFYVTRGNLAALVAIRIPTSVRESIQAELMHVTYKCNGPEDVCRLMSELSAQSLTLTD